MIWTIAKDWPLVWAIKDSYTSRKVSGISVNGREKEILRMFNSILCTSTISMYCTDCTRVCVCVFVPVSFFYVCVVLWVHHLICFFHSAIVNGIWIFSYLHSIHIGLDRVELVDVQTFEEILIRCFSASFFFFFWYHHNSYNDAPIF